MNNYYDNLRKSKLTPPNYLFGYVWFFIYIMIIISFFLFIISNGVKFNKIGLIFFIIQLLLNLSWSPIFFYFEKPKIALFIILLMIIFIILTIKNFYKINKFSSYLLIPYLIWSLFAFYLNIVIVILNN